MRRQDEPALVKAVRELCDGEPSPETSQLLKSLDRPVKDTTVEPTMLFGVNFDVDYMNHQKLDEMPGPAKMYKAVDTGRYDDDDDDDDDYDDNDDYNDGDDDHDDGDDDDDDDDDGNYD